MSGFDHDAIRALRPQGGAQLILADPNWSMRMRTAAGYAKSPQAHYACAAPAELAALPVAQIAARDAVLVMWAINPMLPDALALMAAWGFQFKTAGVWLKRTKRDAAWQMGTGYVLGGSTEPFLIGKRGKGLPTRDRGVRGIIDAPMEVVEPIRGHSQKPENIYAVCDRLFGAVRRVELFACTARPGWIQWGDELGKYPAVTG